MNQRSLYRDGITEQIKGPVKVSTTSDGHVVERYTLENGKRRYFVTLAGTHWCAHGGTLAQAIADALWKDPERRPSMEAVKQEVQAKGRKHKFTLNEFRILTGACVVGCREALKRAGRDESPMTADEIRDTVSREWGNKLLSVLEWDTQRGEQGNG